jgi:soluble lytic murein transglycosylase-like protein
LARHIISLCKKYRFDPSFVLSLIEVESGFRVKAVSPVGAVGLMQVMSPTAQFVIQDVGFHFSGHENFSGLSLRQKVLTPQILMEPFINTAIGIAYLAWLRDYYRGYSPYHILAAYNVGPGRMNELLAQKSFSPVETKKYFLNIRRGVSQIRYYDPPARKRSKRKNRSPSRPCTQRSPMV